MKKEANERNSAFDVLRILLALFVIALHFNNSRDGGAFVFANGISREIVLLMEAFAICAVNVFLMLSGYFLCERKDRNAFKPISLIIKVVGYNLLFYFLFLIGNDAFSISGLVHNALPSNYFVWLYGTVYILSPWLNKVINDISKEQFLKLLFVLCILFVIYPTIVDIYCGITGTTINGISTISSTDSGAGYTLIQFIVAYYLGAYLKKYPLEIGKNYCLAGYILNCLIIFGIEHTTMNAIFYNNLFVVMSAFFIMAYFSKISCKSNKVVYELEKVTFDVYIIHCFLFGIWQRMPIEELICKGAIYTLGTSIFMILLMYIISAGIGVVFNIVFNPLMKKIEKRWKVLLYQVK